MQMALRAGCASISSARLLHLILRLFDATRGPGQEGEDEPYYEAFLYKGCQRVKGKDGGFAVLRYNLKVCLIDSVEYPAPSASGVPDAQEQSEKMMLQGYSINLRGRPSTSFLPPPGGANYLHLSGAVDRSLEEEVVIFGVPVCEKTLTLSATLGVPPEADAGQHRARQAPVSLSSGPFAVSRTDESDESSSDDESGAREENKITKPQRTDSVVLMSDYSLVHITCAIENGTYLSPCLCDTRGAAARPAVQVSLDLWSDSASEGTRRKERYPEVIHTTAAAPCTNQPSWGEELDLTLAWGACKRAVFWFKVVGSAPAPGTDDHLGECHVHLSSLCMEQVVRLNKSLHRSSQVNSACGHLQLRFTLKPDLPTAYGRVKMQATMTPALLHPPPPPHLVASKPDEPSTCLAVSWRRPRGDGRVCSAGDDGEESNDPGVSVQRYGRNPKTQSSSSSAYDPSLWRVALDEIIGVAGKCRVEFFDGSDGRLLGASCWSCGLVEHAGERHVMLKPARDRKTPVVAKIVSNEARLSSMKLKIHVLEGRQLKAMDRGGTSDPFVRICVGETKENRAQSKVIPKSVNPTWNEELEAAISEAEMEHDELYVQVWDKDLLTDDLIGQVVLSLSTLSLAAASASSKWYTIHDSKGAAGEVHLDLTLMPTAAPSSSQQTNPASLHPQLCLVVFVESALGLFAADAGGTSDPYAALSVSNDPSIDADAAPAKDQTRVVKKSLNPEWHERFLFDLHRADHEQRALFDGRETWLHVQVFDHNTVSRHESLGTVRIHLEEVFPRMCRYALAISPP